MKHLFLNLLFFTMLSFLVQSCKKDEPENENAVSNEITLKSMIAEDGANPDEADVKATEKESDDQRHRRSGFVYTESNASAQNEILIFRQTGNGSLNYISTVASGGNGSGMGLGSQGALVVSSNKEWLVAVNAGSNSISAFRIMQNGHLTLTSTISSMGTLPVSVTMHHNIVYVVNSTSADIAGFELDQAGILTAIPSSTQALSSTTAMPAQIAFSPNGDYLYVTEKMTNKIAVFEVLNGVAQSATFVNSDGVTPFGYDYARNFMIVSNASGGATGASTVTSYNGIYSGNINSVSGPVPNNQTAACWVATTHYGRFAFVTNTGSDNISSYYVAQNGNLHLVAGNAAMTGDMPIDIIVAGNNYHVYALCSADNSIFEYRRNLWGTLTGIGSVQGVPSSASGLAFR